MEKLIFKNVFFERFYVFQEKLQKKMGFLFSNSKPGEKLEKFYPKYSTSTQV